MRAITSERGKETGEASGAGRLFAIILCFFAQGWLIGRSYSEPVFHPSLFAALSAAFGLIGIFLYTRILMVIIPANQYLKDSWVVKQSVRTGFIMLIPFTLLAMVAEIWFSWNAVITFISAGIMLSGVAVGAELVKLGKQGWRSTAVPAFAAGLFAMFWISIVSLLKLFTE